MDSSPQEVLFNWSVWFYSTKVRELRRRRTKEGSISLRMVCIPVSFQRVWELMNYLSSKVRLLGLKPSSELGRCVVRLNIT